MPKTAVRRAKAGPSVAEVMAVVNGEAPETAVPTTTPASQQLEAKAETHVAIDGGDRRRRLD